MVTQTDLDVTIVREQGAFINSPVTNCIWQVGDEIDVIQRVDGGWWEGRIHDVVGWFPSNYVELGTCCVCVIA